MAKSTEKKPEQKTAQNPFLKMDWGSPLSNEHRITPSDSAKYQGRINAFMADKKKEIDKKRTLIKPAKEKK